MRGANMSVVGRAVVKCFATRGTRESAFGRSLVVGFQVTSEVFLFPKLFVAAGTFVRFLPSMDALMGYKVIGASKYFPAGVATMFLARLFGRELPVTRLNILRLIIIR